MDEVSDFFDFSKPFQRVTIPGGYVNGRVVADEDVFDKEIKKREEIGDSYAKLFQDAEQQQILQTTVGAPSIASKAMSHIGDLEDIDDEMPECQPRPVIKEEALYDKYNFDMREELDLPIMDSRSQILCAIEENPVVVLKGDTGCGKTTQVPQFILNEFYRRKEHCNIICTQPRRIAAISIANRVCSERGWELGSLVGYQVGLHAQASDDTRLLYCTTGILLQKLIANKTMNNYTHIILDEVHERDQDMDFLLILVRRLLTTNSLTTKVVLMSATINTEEFSEYFKVNVKGTLMPAPILNVDTRRLFNISEFYLCQLGKLNLKPELIDEPDVDNPSISDDMYNAAVKLVLVCERIDEKSVHEDKPVVRPSVLIFLPGVNEIDRMDKALQRSVIEQFKLKILRLHSLITPDEQQMVFRRPPEGYRKVILSTNIAESSITVSDVKYVIDFCLTKSLVTDTSTNLTSLQLSWAARSNCKQRAGRAGRVMNGRVFRLVSKYFYENVMIETGSPEMIRCPLENVVLKAKLLEMGPPHAILALAMTPPNLSDIRNTILTLKECGALFKTVNGKYEPFDGDLTFIGRVMAALPIDIRITRLIIFGYIFSVLEETIIIAAGLNVKSIFYFPYNNVLDAFTQKLDWSDGSGSDLFAILKAYTVWSQNIQLRNIENDEGEASWSRRYFINTRSMKELHLLVSELKSRLANVGMKEITGVHRVKWSEKEKSVVLKIAIAGAFYPNYFVRATSTDQATQKEIYQVLGGRDPCTTVFLTGFDSRYIGQLYTEPIKNLFRKCVRNIKNIKVTFEAGSQKIFVSFGSNVGDDTPEPFNRVIALPGRVCPEVYKAVKMRKLRSHLSFKVMRPQDAIAYAESLHVGSLYEGVWIPYKKPIQNASLYVIPPLYIDTVRGVVTHIETCSKFYIRPLSEDERLAEIEAELNSRSSDLMPFNDPSEISRGDMVAATYEEGSKRKFYRARVNYYERSRRGIAFKVLFIDYGNYDTIEMHNIRRLGPNTSRFKDLPPRIFECYLSEVQPSSINCPHGKWPNEAMVMMQEFVDRGIVEAQVYSVVNGIASVVLKLGNDSFNQFLIEKGIAQYSEENYMSKMDHDLRLRKIQVMDASEDSANLEYLRRQETEEEIIVDPPPQNKCHIKVDLRGPFSPLETQVYASTQVGKYKKITIEAQSVNTILLDSDPQNSTEKLLVSASVTENPSRGEMVARQTTVMPNIPGFPALMALMFAPTVEMKRDSINSRYIGLLAGLGCDNQGNAIFEEHDMVFNFDVEITPDDLEKINQLRYTMELLVHTDPGETIPKVDPNFRKQIPTKIKSLLLGLLGKSRKRIEVQRSKKDNCWNTFEESDLLDVSSTFEPAIFGMHRGLMCRSETFERMQILRMHCADLYRTGKHDVTIKPTLCQLCGETLETALQLRIHLLSQLHRDRELQIGFSK